MKRKKRKKDKEKFDKREKKRLRYKAIQQILLKVCI